MVWLQTFVVPPSAHILIRLVSGTGAVGDDASVSESELFTLRSSLERHRIPFQMVTHRNPILFTISYIMLRKRYEILKK